LPDSFKDQCLVRSKVGTDEKVLKERQEITRCKTPAELSKIGGLSDFPVPILFKKREETVVEKWVKY
jgi:hypothetical protein